MSVNGNNLLRAAALAIDTPNASLVDLADNDMIVGPLTAKSQIEAYIAQARNGGDWSMPGVTSSSAASHAQGATMLGVLSGAEYVSVNGFVPFNGVIPAALDTLVKYTWYGDTDFNGEVNFDDYVRIDIGFNFGLTGWLNGDFDLSGGVDFDDVVLIDLGFNAQNGTLRRAQAYLSGDDRSMHGMSDDPALRMVAQHFEQYGVAYARGFLAAVPEPAHVALLSLASFASTLPRRRHHRRRPSIPTR
jgi:hypothetical protein